MSFGRWLFERRKARKLTQPQLAERVGVSVSYISALERKEPGATGKDRQPSLDIVDRIARALSQNKDEARVAAGYAPEHLTDRPRTAKESLALIGKLIPGFEGVMTFEGMDDETAAKLLEDFKTLAEVRRHQNKS